MFRVFVLVLLAGACNGKTEQATSRISTISTSPAIAESSGLYDLVCKNALKIEGIPYEELIQLHSSTEVVEAWRIVNSESEPGYCWEEAIMAIGILGGPAEITSLRAYIVDPQHKVTSRRFGTYGWAIRAMSAIVGKNKGDSGVAEGVELLLKCTDPTYWSAQPLFLRGSHFDKAKFSERLAAACIEALGYTRAPDAESKLNELKASDDPREAESAKIGLEIAQMVDEHQNEIDYWVSKIK